MKQSKWFGGVVSSLLMGAMFSMLFGISACKGPNDDDNGAKEVEKVKVTFSVEGAGGTITAKIKGESKNLSNNADVEKGKTVVFTAKADAGYEIASWKQDGVSTEVSGNKTEDSKEVKVAKKLDVKVVFKQVKKEDVELKFTAGEHGKLTAKVGGVEKSSGDKIEKGSTVVFTAEADSGYKVGAWTGVTPATPDATTATVTADANLDVSVTFVEDNSGEQKKFAVTFKVEPADKGTLKVTAMGVGDISSGDEVKENSMVWFHLTITDSEYEVDSWTPASLKISAGDNGLEKGKALIMKLTKAEDVVVTLKKKSSTPTEKKDAEISFVSINSTAWDPATKKIVLDTPTGEAIKAENIKLKAKSVDGSIAETDVEVLEFKGKETTDKLDLAEGETSTLIIKSKESDSLKSAEVEVVVHVWKSIKATDFSFEETKVTSTDATNKEQTIEITSTYKADTFEPLATKFIGSYLERKDKAALPEGAKIKIKYELTLNGQAVAQPAQESAEYEVLADKKRIYGCEIFPGAAAGVTADKLKHQFLNEQHVGAKEKFTITVTLPATVKEDIELVNVCGLFDAEDAKEPVKELGKTEFTVKGVADKTLTKVEFGEVTVETPDTKSAERKAKFEVTYPEFELSSTEKFIDAVLTLKDNKPFPKDAKIKVGYTLTLGNGTVNPKIESEYDVKDNETKIFGHTLFEKFNESIHHPKDRTTLNANHIKAKELYELTMTLPEGATEDEYEITVVSALFATKDATDYETKLGEKTFKIRGYEIQKVTNAIESECANDTTDATKATKTISYSITYPQFSYKEGQFLDSVIKMKDGLALPEGTKITLEFKSTLNPSEGRTFEEYTVGAGVMKLFGSDLSKNPGGHPTLNAALKGEKQIFVLKIVMPNTATNAEYVIETYTAVFATADNTDKNQAEVKKLGDSLELKITGYGK